MLLDILKSELRQLLAAANTPSVLVRLKAVLSEESVYFDAVFIQSGHLKSLENQQIAGTIGASEYKIEQTRTCNLLLKLLII